MWRTKTNGGIDTDFEVSSKTRRGPRTALSDPQLHNRRDQLIQAFAGAWPVIGWPLETCKQPEDLIQIFLIFQRYQSSQEIVGVFCRSSTEAADSRALKRLRAQLRNKTQEIGDAENEQRRAQEQFREANHAFTQASKVERHLVKRVLNRKGKETIRAGQKAKTLKAEEQGLRENLKNMEARFSRQEIFHFLKSRRYELTPVSLANATANLPFSCWRQSMRRCRLSPTQINGVTYHIFKAIRYLAGAANKRNENILVNDFRNGIPLLPSRYKVARAMLAEHWFFVERAIRKAFKHSKHPRALSFEITHLYLEQLQTISSVEQVLATQEKMELRAKKSRDSR